PPVFPPRTRSVPSTWSRSSWNFSVRGGGVHSPRSRRSSPVGGWRLPDSSKCSVGVLCRSHRTFPAPTRCHGAIDGSPSVVSALYDSAQPCPRRTPSGTGSGQAVPPERPLRVVVGDVWGAARGAWPLRVVVGDGRAGPSPTGRTLLRIAPAIGLEPITCRLTAG